MILIDQYTIVPGLKKGDHLTVIKWDESMKYFTAEEGIVLMDDPKSNKDFEIIDRKKFTKNGVHPITNA